MSDSNDDDDDDIWTHVSRSAQPRDDARITSDTRVDLTPDAGRDQPQGTARPLLETALFGQPGKPNAYALIDPALAFGLEEQLDLAECQHRSLHRTPESNDAASAYPWLVTLTPDSKIFKRLCANRDLTGWWEDEPAILLRSALDFDAVWSHLRKFHRVQDADGSWVFVRYWDPELFVRMVAIDLPMVCAMLDRDTDYIARYGPAMTVLGRVQDTPPKPARLRPGDLERIGALRTGRRHRIIAKMIRKTYPDALDETDDATLNIQVAEALDAADRVGLRNGESRAKFTIMSIISVPGLDKDKPVLAYLQRNKNPDRALRDLNDVIRARVRGAIQTEQI